MFYLKKTQTISDFTFKSMSTEILHSGLWVVLWLFVLRLIKYGELRFKRVTFKLQYYIKLGKNVSISVDSRIDFYNMLVFFILSLRNRPKFNSYTAFFPFSSLLWMHSSSSTASEFVLTHPMTCFYKTENLFDTLVSAWNTSVRLKRHSQSWQLF